MPKQSAAFLGKFIAFEILFLQNYEKFMVAMLLF